MFQRTFVLTLLYLTSCGRSNDVQRIPNKTSVQSTQISNESPIATALKFINLYVENCNKLKDQVGVINWVNANNLTTKRFKIALKNTIDEAYKQDPELGLEVDPLFDAQDYPGKGFDLDIFYLHSNYIVVKGKNWPEFKLTMKLVLQNGSWLVDGCGSINVPNEKRIQR